MPPLINTAGSQQISLFIFKLESQNALKYRQNSKTHILILQIILPPYDVLDQNF